MLKKLFSKPKKVDEKPEQATPVEGRGGAKAKPPATDDTTRAFEKGLVSTKDIIAPSALEVDFDHLRIGNKYHRTLFVAGYPRFVGLNWLSPLINFDASLNISMYVYPTDGKEILDDLRRKIAEMEAEINTDIQRGRVVNPATQAKLEDALNLQNDLVKGEERFFQFGLYVTISADSVDQLNQINKNLEAALGSLLIISKRATLQMEEGFKTTLPTCRDVLNVVRNMDTTSLATTFPFVSSDLSDDKGIMYGINEHNGSLVIFDRFSMPNYNSVVFATSGAGKSYLIKLEVLRSLMMGTDIIVIDPENEYKNLCEAVGGQYVAFGFDEESKINPFDLGYKRQSDKVRKLESEEEEEENLLHGKVLALHKLFKIMLGEMDAIEESILDKAIMAAYKGKGITPDPESQDKEAPLLEDLYKSLIGMEEEKARGLAARLEKYIKGSFAGIFNQKTTVNLKSNMVVFGIKNLEDALRPMAMQIVLDYVWTIIKTDLRKRILVVDEAWYLMQHPDSAAFLRGVIKRGRKYFLGTTTITQDVEDFLETPYGKEIVTNSAIQILLKQHSAAIDKVAEVFYLSEGEKQLLLAADKGEGIFFAGANHVAVRVIASEEEHGLITSDPGELIRQKKRMEEKLEENRRKKEEEPAMKVSQKNENDEGQVESSKGQVARDKGQVASGKEEAASGKEEAARDKEEVESSKLQVESGKEQVTSDKLQVARDKLQVARDTSEKPEGPEKGDETDFLQRKIAEMEAEENKKIEEFRQKETKIESSGVNKSGLLYKQLGSPANKLPPLPKQPATPLPPPPRPSSQPLSQPKTSNQLPPLPKKQEKPLLVSQAVDDKNEKKGLTFLDNREKQIPQPPQLQKAQSQKLPDKAEPPQTETKPKVNIEEKKTPEVGPIPPLTTEKIQTDSKTEQVEEKKDEQIEKKTVVKDEDKGEVLMEEVKNGGSKQDKPEEKPATEIKVETVSSDKPNKKLTYEDLFGKGS